MEVTAKLGSTHLWQRPVCAVGIARLTRAKRPRRRRWGSWGSRGRVPALRTANATSTTTPQRQLCSHLTFSKLTFNSNISNNDVATESATLPQHPSPTSTLSFVPLTERTSHTPYCSCSSDCSYQSRTVFALSFWSDPAIISVHTPAGLSVFSAFDTESIHKWPQQRLRESRQC